MLNYIFYMIILIMMFLCFFALQSSMIASIYNGSKEIAILRSIGFTRYRISMLYFYEALLLVLASCIQGIFIGMSVGFTMVLQQALFMKLQVVFFFPGMATLEILGLSIICAFLSTCGPTSRLGRKSISSLYRN